MSEHTAPSAPAGANPGAASAPSRAAVPPRRAGPGTPRPPAPEAPRWRFAVVPVAIALVAGAVGYLLGYEEYSSRSAKVIAPAVQRPCASADAKATRVSGLVRSASGGTLVVQAGAGRRVDVAIGSAEVCRTVGARLDDLRAGDRVSVTGRPGADGTIDATHIVITTDARASGG